MGETVCTPHFLDSFSLHPIKIDFCVVYFNSTVIDNVILFVVVINSIVIASIIKYHRCFICFTLALNKNSYTDCIKLRAESG